MKKKIILVVLLFFASFLMVVEFGPRAEANLLQDLYRYFKPMLPPALSPTPKTEAPGKTQEIEKSETTSSVQPKPIIEYKPVIEYEEAVIAAVERIAPSVVSIVISKDLPVLEQCPYDPFGGFFNNSPLGDGFQFYVPCPSPSGKTEKKKIGGGSGFIVSRDGLILTNRHVVSDQGASYTVFLSNEKKYEAKVLAVDKGEDLAILKIEAAGLPAAALGDSNSVKLGQTAIAIGNALAEFENTVSAGVVSGIGRNVSASGGGEVEMIEGVIQTDAAINPGNSGGPLVNLKGEVIGINTAVALGAENIGFALPINKAKRSLESFRVSGRIVVPFLGVGYEMTDEGAKIAATKSSPAVIAGSAADQAGLKEGDLILEVNGKAINKNNTLSSAIKKFDVGDTVTLKVKRGSETLILKAVLSERK